MPSAAYNLPMQDRPTAEELLEAVEGFLDSLVAQLKGSPSFHTRVAANAVRIVRRELQRDEDASTAEWKRLDAILGAEPPPAGAREMRDRLRERNEALCRLIRDGGADAGETAERVREHVRASVRAKLEVSDPGLLERSSAGPP